MSFVFVEKPTQVFWPLSNTLKIRVFPHFMKAFERFRCNWPVHIQSTFLFLLLLFRISRVFLKYGQLYLSRLTRSPKSNFGSESPSLQTIAKAFLLFRIYLPLNKYTLSVGSIPQNLQNFAYFCCSYK